MKSDVHGCVLQHIRDDKEPNHTPSNVNLIQLRHSPIATSDSDILQRDVEVILSYSMGTANARLG
jgi:hypothetical protein